MEREIPILYKRKEECCGCTACYAICPKEAISMVEDEEGFEYPKIDENKCVHCYQCMMVPFSAVSAWTFGEKIGNGWKKILWQNGKIAFIFSISIEMLQLLLRLGTFQLSDIFYNTVGGVLGGLMYCAVMKARKRL